MDAGAGVGPGGSFHLYRSFRFGRLPICSCSTRGASATGRCRRDLAALTNPTRTLIGAAQEEWLFDRLRGSQRDGTAWRVMGQQTIFSRISSRAAPCC